jgi:predicted GNAT family N-acyltransferase
LQQTLVDKIDDFSLNLFVRQAGSVCAAVRLTKADQALQDPQLSHLIDEADLDDLSNVVINSRLVAASVLGAKRHLMHLFVDLYRAGLAVGAQKSVIATRENLVGFFKKLGFVQRSKPFYDPVAGRMEIMTLDPFDQEYLRFVGSPFLTALEAHQ